MSYLARDVLNPRAFIYSSNADGLVIQTTTPDTRISFINSENNVEDLATVFYLSSSNNTFSVGNKNSNILTSIQSVNDEGFLNTGVVNPKKVLFQEDTNRQVVFKDYDVNSQFAGIGYTDGSMVVQLPSTSSKYEVKAASGALNTNLLNLVYDTGTQESRLGIGITNPQYALDVRGDIISSGTVIASNLQILGDTTIINTITSNTDQVVVINDGTGPALQVTQIGAEPVATFYDDSYLAMIVADGGNIGIGTNNPRQTLEVVGNTIVSGKVGIGTLIPNKKLDIVGDIQITGQIFKNGTVFTDVYSEWLLNPDNSNLTTTVSGNLGVGTTEPTQKFEVIGNMKSEKIIADGSELTNLNAGNISFGTIDNNRLPADISVTSLKGDGSGLTALNATNISSGTLNNARLPSTITVTTVNADVTGDLTGNVSGSISGGSVAGEGSGLTSLNATNISSGTLNNARLPSDISVTSLTGDGSGLTSLNATNISSGTLNNARLPSTITVTNVNADLTGNVSGSISGGSVAGEGSGLTALNATNISSGTLDNARLPSAISVTSLTGDGSGLTALNATNISSGTLNNARLPSTITVTTVNADVTGDLTGNVSGSISGGSVAGEGSGLTALNATNISSGTLNNSRLPANISVTSLTGDGGGLTSLNATNISSGTLNNARLPSAISVTSIAADGSTLTNLNAGNISSGTIDNARLPSAISVTSLTGDGSGLTALNADNISSGTLNNSRLPTTVNIENLTATGNIGIGTASSTFPLYIHSDSALLTSKNGKIAIASGIGAIEPSTDLEIVNRSDNNTHSGILLRNRGNVYPTSSLRIRSTRFDNSTDSAYSASIGLARYNDNTYQKTNSPLGAIHFGGNHTNNSTDNIKYAASIQGIAEADFVSDSNVNIGLAFYTGSNAYQYIDTAASDKGIEQLRITSDGKVGIHTSTPNVSLEVIADDAILLPKGTTLNRPSAVKGYIRYNTQTDEFEGVGAGNTWGALGGGGVISIAGDTYILAEYSPGNDDKGLHFYTNNQESMILTSNNHVGIGSTIPLVTIDTNATDAFKLPSGSNSDRPTGVAGYIRYNTETLQFEGYGAGDAWGSLGGVKSVAGDTYILAEYSPGNDDKALHFYTNGTEKMIIDSNGNVGIGTVTPLGLDVYKNSSIGEGLLGNYNSYSGGPFFKQQGWGSTGTTHTISYPDYCVNDNSSGTINIQIKSASGDKLGNVSISFLKKNSTDVDIFSIYYHKTANMTTLTVSPSTNDIQVSTDSDCAISWSSTGSC